jgi:PERQ amino acid-rich with GYF domain-containing protein
MEDDNPLGSREPPSAGRGPFGGLMRSNTSGTTGVGPLWPPTPAAATPGGSAGGFGNFSFANSTNAAATSAIGDKRFGSSRGESRLAHLMPKESTENIGGKSNEASNADFGRSWRSRPRTDTDPFGDDALGSRSGLAGTQEGNFPPSSQRGGRLGAFETPTKGNTGDFGMAGLSVGAQSEQEHAPSSPETNPYRSPPAERRDGEDEEAALERPHGISAAAEHASIYGTMPRGFAGNTFDGSDRSQTSSAGPRGYPPLSGLTGWPAPGIPASGTPDHERVAAFGSAFSASVFGQVGDLQSPGMANFGNAFDPTGGPTVGGSSSMRSGSKMGSLFPAPMQAQMQAQETDSMADPMADFRQAGGFGDIGRNPLGQHRDTDSPIRTGRGGFPDLYSASEGARPHGIFSGSNPALPMVTQSQQFTTTSAAAPFGAQNPADVPTTQTRQMVMPDRMRWVYLDSSATIQGPFTGLEMNEWYKLHYFTPDLPVKKVEDKEFEPLAHLIRRIGNSREPFLVPQIGIAHGPPAPTTQYPASSSSGVVVPPLSSVFPTFGRTLTAEEQNNLERRKQEEQLMLAQNREFMIRQHAIPKYPGGVPGALHHHSSAHSLQSQPSFGSMTSPIGMPPHQTVGTITATSGFLDQQGIPAIAGAIGAGPRAFREDEPLGLNSTERQILAPFRGPGDTGSQYHAQPIGAPPSEGTLRSQLPETEHLQEDPEGFRSRLTEFEMLRAERERAIERFEEGFEADEPSPVRDTVQSVRQELKDSSKARMRSQEATIEETLALSLAERVVQAQAAAAKAANIPPAHFPTPPPPQQSGTPLPAPMAQRARSNLPEQYSRSRSETPETAQQAAAQQPTMAPWAREPGLEAQRGPSLKDIQAAEVKKAAKAEEAAAAVRRAQAEQEAVQVREREKATVTATGLATTSTWGNGSPVAATASSPWSRPGVTKVPSMSAAMAQQGAQRRTLADIQREEEARKNKQKEMSAQTGAPAPAGKRYADLASRPNATPGVPQPAVAPVPGSGWATVGAGGKVKIPTGPAAQSRAVSASSAKPVATAKPAAKLPSSGSISGKASPGGSEAQQEFRGWLQGQLSRGLNDNVNGQSTSPPQTQPLHAPLSSYTWVANIEPQSNRLSLPCSTFPSNHRLSLKPSIRAARR